MENRGYSTWNMTDDERSVGIFMNNSWQTVYSIHSSNPIRKVTSDVEGNPIAILDLGRETLPSNSKVRYYIEYKIILKPRSLPEIMESRSLNLGSISESLREKYCVDEGAWQSYTGWTVNCA